MFTAHKAAITLVQSAADLHCFLTLFYRLQEPVDPQMSACVFPYMQLTHTHTHLSETPCEFVFTMFSLPILPLLQQFRAYFFHLWECGKRVKEK